MKPNAEIAGQFDRMFQALLDVHQSTRSHPERREVSRVCLHTAEALENYMSDVPPPNYGGRLAKGIRSRPGTPEVADAELAACIEGTQQDTRRYLETLDLTSEKDAWGMPPLKRVLYVMRHTQYHLGQISRLVDGTYDINKLCQL